MSVIFSRKCEYALQAVLYLATKKKGEMVSIKDLSRKLKIPYHFIGKIFQTLAYKKLLISGKGPNGGFALGKPAEKISLLQIVEAVDGLDFNKKCVSGFRECSNKHPCSAHDQWFEIREDIHSMLAHKNILEMAKKMRKPQYQ